VLLVAGLASVGATGWEITPGAGAALNVANLQVRGLR
jgi:hypothetical protein